MDTCCGGTQRKPKIIFKEMNRIAKKRERANLKVAMIVNQRTRVG
jgi:hypothetical protein